MVSKAESGAPPGVTHGQITFDSSGIVKVTSSAQALGAATQIINDVISWTGDAAGDLDDVRVGLAIEASI